MPFPGRINLINMFMLSELFVFISSSLFQLNSLVTQRVFCFVFFKAIQGLEWLTKLVLDKLSAGRSSQSRQFFGNRAELIAFLLGQVQSPRPLGSLLDGRMALRPRATRGAPFQPSAALLGPLRSTEPTNPGTLNPFLTH